jgi:hypothetical protein
LPSEYAFWSLLGLLIAMKKKAACAAFGRNLL